MPRDEFTAEAFFKGFTEGWLIAGGDGPISTCPVPEPHFDEVEYLIDQVRPVAATLLHRRLEYTCQRCSAAATVLFLVFWFFVTLSS